MIKLLLYIILLIPVIIVTAFLGATGIFSSLIYRVVYGQWMNEEQYLKYLMAFALWHYGLIKNVCQYESKEY